VVALAAYGSLDQTGRSKVVEEVAKLAVQFIVIVVAGAFVKMILEDLQAKRKGDEEELREQARRDQEDTRARQADWDELSEIKRSYIRRVLDARHRVDRAQMLIRANRSVRTWSIQMQGEVIEAYLALRDVNHDLVTATQAGHPVFVAEIREPISRMANYLDDLIVEFGDKKKELSELQLKAEKDRRKQIEVWRQLQGLERLGDLIHDGDGYRSFQSSCRQAVAGMRAGLTARPVTPFEGREARR
jgi:hypothetical protein